MLTQATGRPVRAGGRILYPSTTWIDNAARNGTNRSNLVRNRGRRPDGGPPKSKGSLEAELLEKFFEIFNF